LSAIDHRVQAGAIAISGLRRPRLAAPLIRQRDYHLWLGGGAQKHIRRSTPSRADRSWRSLCRMSPFAVRTPDR